MDQAEQTEESRAGETGTPRREPFEEGSERVRQMVRNADEATRDFVRQRPLVAIGGALLAGYLVGRLFSRS